MAATEKAYRHGIRIWRQWCSHKRVPTVPAVPSELAECLVAHTTCTKSVVSVRKMLSGIASLHADALLPSPAHSMRAIMAGIVREYASRSSRQDH